MFKRGGNDQVLFELMPGNDQSRAILGLKTSLARAMLVVYDDAEVADASFLRGGAPIKRIVPSVAKWLTGITLRRAAPPEPPVCRTYRAIWREKERKEELTGTRQKVSKSIRGKLGKRG